MLLIFNKIYSLFVCMSVHSIELKTFINLLKCENIYIKSLKTFYVISYSFFIKYIFTFLF